MEYTKKQVFLVISLLFLCTRAAEPERFQSTLICPNEAPYNAWPCLESYNYVVERADCSCAPPSFGQRWFPALYINCSEWLASAPDPISIVEGTACNGGILYPFLGADVEWERVPGNNGTHVTYECHVRIRSLAALSLSALSLSWLISILCTVTHVRTAPYRPTFLQPLYRVRKLIWLFTLLYFLSNLALVSWTAPQRYGCFLYPTTSTTLFNAFLLFMCTFFVYLLTYLSIVLYAAIPPSEKQD